MAKSGTSLPMLYARGSHYDVGYSAGDTYTKQIKLYVNECEDVQRVLVPFYDSPEGRAVFDQTLAETLKNFPQYVDEIKGTALGAGLPFERVFLLNMERDVVNGHARTLRDDGMGCTTVVVNRPDVKIIGHNEDANSTVCQYGYMVDVHVLNDGGEEKEHFTGLCYPGKLPGNTISFNHHGLVTAMDNVRVRQTVTKTPSQVVLRAMMSARCLDDVVTILTNKGFGCAVGMAVLVWSLSDTEHPSVIEVCPSGVEASCHVIRIEDSSYFHVNKFRHREADELLPKYSSDFRSQRIMSLPPPKCLADVRNILGDTEIKEYPIYRKTATFSTAIIDVLKKELQVYLGNPKTSSPLLCLPLTLCSQQ